MNYYFDISFINSLNGNFNISDNIRSEFMILCKQLTNSSDQTTNCILIYDSDLNLDENKTNPLFRQIFDTNKNIEFKDRKDLTSILEDENSSGFKFFFLDNVDSKINIGHEYGFFHISANVISKEWPRLSNNRVGTRMFLSQIKSPSHITKWDDISSYNQPINSIILNDKFLLTNIDELDFNLFGLLDSLGIKSLEKRRVDIIIFCNKLSDENNPTKKKNLENKLFEQAFIKITEYFNRKIGKSKYNFTLIKVDTDTNPNQKELHYRVLLTNMLFINPGQSFTFFDKRGKIKAGEFINFDYFIWENARAPISVPISTFKKALQKIVNRPKINDDPEILRIKTHNDKKSRLLV